MKRMVLTLALTLSLAAPAAAGPVPDCRSPKYGPTVMQSHRQLMCKTSLYGQPPAEPLPQGPAPRAVQ